MIITKTEAVRKLDEVVSMIEIMLEEVEGFDMESAEWKRLINNFEKEHSYYFNALESMKSHGEELLSIEMRNWAALIAMEGRREIEKFDKATSELL